MPAANRLLLGRCTLELTSGELRDAEGELAGLRKQALDVLLVLGRRAGEVINKDELMNQVWPKVVVGEGSLTQAIADIRRVLGDDEHRLVRNVARRGYMLVPDKPLSGAAVEARAELSAAAPAAREFSRPPRPWWRPGLISAVVLAVLLAGGAWLTWRSTSSTWRTPAELARTPLSREVPALSIIVLPLTLEGERTDAEWLADALHGDLVIAVAQMQNSFVIARDTASTYKGKAVDPRQVAREMGVRHVVQGSLRQEGGRIRLNLTLIDGESGVQRWAEAFDTDRAQLAQAVSDFAVAIERTLVAELYRSTGERLATLSPTEVSADDLAMQGYALWYRGVTRENVLAARALFDRALAMNPDSARAWGGVHFTTTAVLSNGWTDRSACRGTQGRGGGSQPAAARPRRQLHLQRQDIPAFPESAISRRCCATPPSGAGATGCRLAFGAHGAALTVQRALRRGGRGARTRAAPWPARPLSRGVAVPAGAGALRRRPLRAGANEWSQTAANTTPRWLWPPIHAAALLRLGQRRGGAAGVRRAYARHPGFVTAQVRRGSPERRIGRPQARCARG